MSVKDLGTAFVDLGPSVEDLSSSTGMPRSNFVNPDLSVESSSTTTEGSGLALMASNVGARGLGTNVKVPGSILVELGVGTGDSVTFSTSMDLGLSVGYLIVDAGDLETNVGVSCPSVEFRIQTLIPSHILESDFRFFKDVIIFLILSKGFSITRKMFSIDSFF